MTGHIFACRLTLFDGAFCREALDYFRREVPVGYQREDGIACFSEISRFWFWRFRLRLMVWAGLLRCFRGRSIWRSCDGMLYFGLPRPMHVAVEYM